jgi:plasmid stabilization system protein ParE
MTIVRILPPAVEELEASISRYESQQPGLGAAFLVEFKRTRERILELPEAARLIRGEVRRRPIHRFPYAVLYRVSIDEIVIVAVAHRRRRPGFWRGRQ